MSVERVKDINVLSWSKAAYTVDELPRFPQLEFDIFTHDEHVWDGDLRGEIDELEAIVSIPDSCIEPPLILTEEPMLLVVRRDVQERFKNIFASSVEPITLILSGGQLQNRYDGFALRNWMEVLDENWTSNCPTEVVDQFRDMKTIVHPIFDIPSRPKHRVFGVRHYQLPFFHTDAWELLVDSADGTWQQLCVSSILRYV